MIIDAWLQHPTIRFLNNPIFENLRRWMKIELLENEIPIESTIAAMDAGKVDKALICAWSAPFGDLISNEEVAKHISQYPDRFIGIGCVPLNKPMKAIDTLKRQVEVNGFKGLRIVQWLWNLPATNAYYYPIFATCVDLDIPVCLQVGHTGPLMPSELGKPIPYIDQIAIDFPDLKIVCGHIGYPWTNEMIAVSTKHPNVFIDTSAYSTNRYPQELVQYLKTNGTKKILFGTNYPMITPKKALEHLDSLQLDKTTSQHFLSANAKEIFKIN